MSHFVHIVLGCCALVWTGLPAFSATAITTCPYTITKSGTYHVTQDLSCPAGGIVISANNVDLFLNGHVIDGTGLALGEIGIDNESGANNHIYGSAMHGPCDGDDDKGKTSATQGTIQNFGLGIRNDFNSAIITGILFTNNGLGIRIGGFNNSVLGNKVLGNQGNGIQLRLADNAVIKDNVIDNNEGVGIIAESSNVNVIQSNQVDHNGSSGIVLSVNSNDNVIQKNTVQTNGKQSTPPGFDLEDDNPSCDNNTWKNNTFGSANQTCIH
jgi:parallel beta-helix repeat protein